MGCLTRVGCLAVVVAIGAGGYWLYGDQLPNQLARAAGKARVAVGSPAVKPSAAPIKWVSLDSATNGVESVMQLKRTNGPAYVTIGASDLAGFLALGLARALPRSSVDPQVAIVGDRILIRAVVDLRDFAGDGAFGTVIGAAMKGRDTLLIGGGMDVLRPGLAQYHVRELRIKGVDVPSRVIPGLVGALRRRARIDSLAPDALPIVLPTYISDLRVQGGRVTLYRAVK